MRELPPPEIHLSLVFPDDVQDPELLAAYRAMLTDAERAQEKRFYFARDQHRYLLTRALIRTELSSYSAVPPEAWRFGKSEYGRPLIDWSAYPAEPVAFNLTHTDGLIVCAIARAGALGVDAERLHERPRSLDLASRFFSPPEVDALLRVAPGAQGQRFFDYWTLKESYIKAVGHGLAIPLDQFSFDLSAPEHVSIAFRAPYQDEPARWRFWQLGCAAEHAIAVCAEDYGQAASTLIVKRVVPLVSAQPLDCAIMRRSADRAA